MALKGSLLALPSPPAAEARPVRRRTAPPAGWRASSATSGRIRPTARRRRGARAADRGDARGRARARASPTISPATALRGAARSAARGCATSSRRSGPAAGRHLLLVSHYDCTPPGPGASDDGIGVATMLEIAPLLRGRALARPVTFLFDEGEELGLLGARAFLERDPLAARVDTRSISRRAASPGRRSCSRPAGRTAPRSRSTAPPPRGRSPIRSRPTFTG